MNYWLMKSEPSVFSIDDLASRPKQIERWDGVRNYQARNMLRDQMKVGDRAFFYHSSCDEPGIVGAMEIVRSGYMDPTAFDANDHHYDPASKTDNPRWYAVDVRFLKKFSRVITLAELKEYSELSSMWVLRKGNRLSITPVTANEWKIIGNIMTKQHV